VIQHQALNGITITSASSTPLGNYFVAYGDQNDVEGGTYQFLTLATDTLA
jgi:hypothetical protein